MRRSFLIVTVLILTGLYVGRVASEAPVRTELEQPVGWVAFSADVDVKVPGELPLLAQFHRDGIGSTRWDVRRQSDGARIIEIINMSNRTYYVFSTKRGWVSRPVEATEWRPRRLYKEMPRLEQYSFRLDLGTGGSGNLKAKDGFEAYMYTTASGGTRLMVPDLNFFPVVMQTLSGYSRKYFNIRREEPDIALFLPPAGVQVTASPRPFSFKPH